MNPSLQVQIIDSLSEKLRANYVFPNIAEQICFRLKKHLEDGDYAVITEGAFFAFALTMHMQEVCHDEHLWIRWHPEPLPDNDALRQNQKWQEELLLEARLDNFGFYKVERLPGNIGYFDIRYFHKAAWGGDTGTCLHGGILYGARGGHSAHERFVISHVPGFIQRGTNGSQRAVYQPQSLSKVWLPNPVV